MLDKVFVTQSQAFGNAFTEVLDEYIGLGYLSIQDLNPTWVFKVQGDASLLAVQGFKIGVEFSGKLR